MVWGKMDDKFHRNKKVRKLRNMGARGREALGVWAFWWSWCLDDPSLDGVVPLEELNKDELRSAELLCSDLHEGRGLWVRVQRGFLFHDFHAYNPTKEQVEHKREADRARKTGKAPPGFRAESDATPNGTTSDSVASRGGVASTRDPDPTRPIGESDQPQRRESQRLLSELDRLTREEFFKRGTSSKGATNTQRLKACERADEAVDLGQFQTALDALTALVAVAVADAMQPGRADKFGFALATIEFAPSATTLANSSIDEKGNTKHVW